MEEDVTKTVIKTLKAYLHEELPLDKDLFNKLDSLDFLDREKAWELTDLADRGKKDCVWKLVTHMEQFYTEEMLLRLCVFLEAYSQPARPKLAIIASRIRQEILKHKPQVPLPVPEDTLHRSAGVHDAPVPGTSVLATFPLGASSPEPTAPYTPVPTTLSPGTSVPGPTALGAPMSPPSSYTSGNVTRLSSDDRSQPVYLPVIDELKASFCNLVANVFSAIYCLKDLTLFRTFLSHFLKPSFPPGALSPAVPKTVEELDPFLVDRWNSVNIHLLKAVVLHLASRKNESTVFCETIQQVQSELKTYEDLLKVNLHEFLSNCKSESVSLKPLPGHSCVTVKIASSPAEVSLALIVELKGFFNSQLGLPDTLFTGFSEGCTILFFSIPTECVWSLPSCLLPSNLSLLEKWKVIFFSVKGAFTVDIKERKVIDSLGKHSLLSSLSDYKTRNDDLQTKVQQMEKIIHFKEEELTVMKREVKVLKKGKGKAVTTDQEMEEKVSLEGKTVVKTEVSPYPDIKTEPSPDVDPEPSSKRFKTGPDYHIYEPPLEKKSEEKHFLLSFLSDYKTLNDDLQTRNDDLQTRVQQMEKDLHFKEEELRVVEREVKVLRKGKGKALSTDQETLYFVGEARGLMEEEYDDDVTKTVIKTLKAYLHEELPLDKDFIRELDHRNLLASNKAPMLVALVDKGDMDCINQLVAYVEQFYTEEMLLRLCVFLEEYSQPARPKLATIASRIRQEILKHKPQAPLPVPEDILHRSAGVHDDEEALFPVITPLKQQFSELVFKVFVVINKLNEERMEGLHSYLTTLLTPSGGHGMPRHVRNAKLPIVPKPVDELKEYLKTQWDELNIQVLQSIVSHLKDDKLTEMMTHYQQTLSKEGSKTLSECTAETVQLDVAPEESLVPFKIDQSPDQQTLGDVFSLRNLIRTLF